MADRIERNYAQITTAFLLVAGCVYVLQPFLAAILFAAGRYNAFNFVTRGGAESERETGINFYVTEYRKALESNLDGVVGPVVRPQD